MTSTKEEDLYNQIFLLKAQNDLLLQENQSYKRKNQLLEQKVDTLTSLLTVYQLNESKFDIALNSQAQNPQLSLVESLSGITDKISKNLIHFLYQKSQGTN